jgi:hypothetical protein
MLLTLVYNRFERAYTYIIQRSVAGTVYCVYVKYSSAVDSINFSELLTFWAFSIVRYSSKQKTRRFGNWNCFRPQVKM